MVEPFLSNGLRPRQIKEGNWARNAQEVMDHWTEYRQGSGSPKIHPEQRKKHRTYKSQSSGAWTSPNSNRFGEEARQGAAWVKPRQRKGPHQFGRSWEGIAQKRSARIVRLLQIECRRQGSLWKTSWWRSGQRSWQTVQNAGCTVVARGPSED